MHKPIQFKDLSLGYPHKLCFSDFSGLIHFGSRIAIIGRNGVGKSSLLKLFLGAMSPTDGELKIPKDLRAGYLPQIIDDFPQLSGAERLNRSLTKALSLNPNLLLLDEPSNHLDNQNRRSLIRMLCSYSGSLIIVSHDLELITATTDTLWHINAQKIDVFSGTYSDYEQILAEKKRGIEQGVVQLSRQKKESHLALMKEQERGKSLRLRGEKKIKERKWPTIRSHTKLAQSSTTQGKRMSQLREKSQGLLEELSNLYQPEVIEPKFTLRGLESSKILVRVEEGCLAYPLGISIVTELNFQIKGGERLALCGANGSGKSTFLKAILGEPELRRTGVWIVPKPQDIGYLDQHYQHLPRDKRVLDVILDALPKTPYTEIRSHLNDFLFRKNAEVEVLVQDLSGGEKARLSLALIAANPPKLLILDELTNNLDLETRTHVIQVLKAFPGAMIVISHDEDFLRQIKIETWYEISQGRLQVMGHESSNNIDA